MLYNGTPLVLEREKAKELLALLIDRQGLSMTNGEIEAFLGGAALAPNICNAVLLAAQDAARHRV